MAEFKYCFTRCKAALALDREHGHFALCMQSCQVVPMACNNYEVYLAESKHCVTGTKAALTRTESKDILHCACSHFW